MTEKTWFDPFYLNDHLNNDELEIQKNVKDFLMKIENPYDVKLYIDVDPINFV